MEEKYRLLASEIDKTFGFYEVFSVFFLDACIVTEVMTTNAIRVKAKEPQPSRRLGILRIALPLLFSVMFIIGFGWEWNTDSFGLFYAQPEITERFEEGRLIKVPAGGNLQAAIDRANGGDIIELEAGATYNGQINLTKSNSGKPLTIRSSAADKLIEGKRVTPADRQHMARIVSGMLGRAALMASNGASGYRIVGIEFTSTSSRYNYGLVVLGNGETRPENVPTDIEIDRSYIHSNGGRGTVRRGIALNSAHITIKNSYIEGFAYPGEETQGICGWTGTRNVRIYNNYIEGGAENIMFGGADPANAELIPTDIEVTGNHLSKSRSWNKDSTMKTAFELKNAKNVVFKANLITDNLKGSAFRITVRNQDGKAAFSTIENVVVRDNIIDTTGDGINILGRDDTHASQTLRNLTIENNLFLNVGTNVIEGGGYFVLVNDGEGIVIRNNTVLNNGNITTFHGAMPRGFEFYDNIVGHGDYGIHGRLDMRSDAARAMFFNNIFIDLNRIDPSGRSFPPGNEFVSGVSELGFADAASGDYRLSPNSRFAGKGRDGKNPGADLISSSLAGLR